MQRARRLLAPPRVPRAGEVRRAARLELQHRGRRPPRGTSGRARRGSRRRRATASSRSSHSRLATSRWFVGSSRSSRSGSPPSARASDARVSSPPENVSQRPVEVLVREAEPAHDRADALAPRVAARVLEPRLRLGVAAASSARRARPPPSPARAAAAPPRSRRGRAAPESTYSRSVSSRSSGGRWSCSATRVPFANASSPPCISVSPARMRSSVVLPAPFGPESATRSRRSTLNETPSKRTDPASSLRRLDAMTTAIAKPL